MIKHAEKFLYTLAGMSEREVSRYFLGAGSTRESYIFEDRYIIKLPRFVVRFKTSETFLPEDMLDVIKKGVRQTETEISVYNRCNKRIKYLLNPVICYGRFLNMPFVVMPKLKIASNLVHFTIADIFHFIEVLDLCVPWTFEQDLKLLSSKHGLYHDDLWTNMDNFGIDTSNAVFITDYGFRDKPRKIIT